MAIENKQHSKNTLEHVKFTPESDSDNSIVQVKNYDYPVIPDKNVGYFVEYLQNPNDLTSEQNIDGSITPKSFEWSPNPIYGTVLVTGFKVLLVANNITNFFDFANRPTLANGLVIESENQSGTFEYATIKQNIDFSQVADSSGVASFSQQGNTTQNGQALTLFFEIPIIADSDYIFRSIVQDDLTPLSYFKITTFFTTI